MWSDIRFDWKGFAPATAALAARAAFKQVRLARQDPEQSGELVERDQPVGVNDVPQRKYEARDDRGPSQFAPEVWDHGRTGVAARRDCTVLMLAAHAPWQDGEQ